MELRRVCDKQTSLAKAKAFKEQNSNGVGYIFKKLALFVVLLLVITALIAFCTSYIPGKLGLFAPFVVVSLPFIVIGLCISKTCVYFGKSCTYYDTPITEMGAYNNAELINQCWSKTTKWDVEHDIFDQIAEGYCSYASTNSSLSSIYQQQLYLEYPPKPRPLTLAQMRQLFTENIINDDVTNEFPDIKIQSIEIHIVDPQEMDLEQFENMLKDMDTISEIVDDDGNKWKQLIYCIGNFNRTPLFFCNWGWVKRWMKWVISGHFSPIISYCNDDDNAMYILIADVNKEFGNYLVRSDRLYESMQCRQATKTRRGFMKITVQRKMYYDA